MDRRAGNFACGGRALDIDSRRPPPLEYNSRTLVVFQSAKQSCSSLLIVVIVVIHARGIDERSD